SGSSSFCSSAFSLKAPAFAPPSSDSNAKAGAFAYPTPQQRSTLSVLSALFLIENRTRSIDLSPPYVGIDSQAAADFAHARHHRCHRGFWLDLQPGLNAS